MERQSTIHVKGPHSLHIGAKTRALMVGTTMNQYILDLIANDMEKNGLEASFVRRVAESTHEKGRVLDTKEVADLAGVEVTPKIKSEPVKLAGHRGERPFPLSKLRGNSGICKKHGTPLTSNGRCLQKGH